MDDHQAKQNTHPINDSEEAGASKALENHLRFKGFTETSNESSKELRSSLQQATNGVQKFSIADAESSDLSDNQQPFVKRSLSFHPSFTLLKKYQKDVEEDSIEEIQRVEVLSDWDREEESDQEAEKVETKRICKCEEKMKLRRKQDEQS